MTKPKLNKRVHLWIPNMFEFRGGIQVYSAFLLKAIQKRVETGDLDVFLKHDRTPATPAKVSNLRFHCFGHWNPKLRTAAYAATITLRGLHSPPDLILSTHLNFIPAAYLLKQIAGIHYWTVAHGVDAWNLRNPALIQALHHADCILAVSHYTRGRLLQEQNLNPEKVVVLPNTFDASRFHLAPKSKKLLERYHLTPEQPVILTVARLDTSERYKGYDQILQALPQIRRQLPTVHYLLVGRGNDRPRIEQLICNLNLQDCVTLTGFIPDDNLSDHYNLCDVFAMPSKGEGFGIVYLEALACGKPTVGGNQDGAIDALCQGELGVLVDPDNVTEIATILTQILKKNYSHSLLYRPEQLRQQVIAKFGFERFQQTLHELLLSASVIPSPSH